MNFRLIIFLISVALFFAEWFVVRRTVINGFIPIMAAFAVCIPLGAAVGLHLVVFPLLFMCLALAVCAVEDLFFKRRGMTEAEKSKLKDL